MYCCESIEVQSQVNQLLYHSCMLPKPECSKQSVCLNAVKQWQMKQFVQQSQHMHSPLKSGVKATLSFSFFLLINPSTTQQIETDKLD